MGSSLEIHSRGAKALGTGCCIPQGYFFLCLEYVEFARGVFFFLTDLFSSIPTMIHVFLWCVSSRLKFSISVQIIIIIIPSHVAVRLLDLNPDSGSGGKKSITPDGQVTDSRVDRFTPSFPSSRPKNRYVAKDRGVLGVIDVPSFVSNMLI
jgi:hypothetical protein